MGKSVTTVSSNETSNNDALLSVYKKLQLDNDEQYSRLTEQINTFIELQEFYRAITENMRKLIRALDSLINILEVVCNVTGTENKERFYRIKEEFGL